MRLKVWEPFREFKPFYRDVDRLINEFGRGHQLTEGPEKETWSPKVDIYETEGSYVLNAELPGLKKEEIKIDLNDNTLTLKGERKFEEKVEKENYVRIESSYGSFARSFVLSDKVNGENITANYKDGVLEVTLPKKEEAKPKEIKVEIN
ncbi:MAG: Hsp20/alpha crystallin family protein [Deltaproteobacteria bacterium]|nr:Hsp20/alpha crystallin family protein [Deltaproteobacteria bacterium]MCK5709147.1 Hsp20/alpha crystallin family protein [Deltaproteobacteria bacterium]